MKFGQIKIILTVMTMSVTFLGCGSILKFNKLRRMMKLVQKASQRQTPPALAIDQLSDLIFVSGYI